MPVGYYSPLRYPGGKAIIADFLADLIGFNDLTGCRYYEPYAGGAGAALSLLNSKSVSEIFLNDADFRIYSFWKSVLTSPDRFIEKLASVPLTIEEWQKQKFICDNFEQHKLFDVGFATFYMNRCNRSGVINDSGPIGGYEQSGNWKMDVRFNRETLILRISRLKTLIKRIHIFNFDALKFLKTMLPKGINRRSIFVYLDPPYVRKGQRIYMNAYSTSDHRKLAFYLKSQKVLPWIMSYDESPLIRALYSQSKLFKLPIRYTLAEKRKAQELIVAPKYVTVPSFCRFKEDGCLLERVA